jgi:cell division protein FtsB
LQALEASSKMAREMKDGNPEKPRISSRWMWVLIVAGILILGDLNRRMGDARRLERDASALETEVAAQAEENVRLQTQVAEANSEALVREWAHGDGGLIEKGEVLVVPLPPPEETPAPMPTPTPVLEEPSNWQVWWALLFGE